VNVISVVFCHLFALLLLIDNVKVSASPRPNSNRADHKDMSPNEKLPQGDWFA